MTTVRGLAALLAGVGLLAILGLTLSPNPQQAEVADLTPLLCLVCGEAGGTDVVLNLLLFMPMAAGLALLGWPWGRVAAVCALLSLGVETAQYFPLTGRDASLSDVLTNTTGGAAAAAIAMRLERLLAPGPALARRLSLTAAAAWLGILAFTALSLRPWAPPGRLRNYCTPSFPTSEVFAGTARAMTLNGVALACDRDVPHGTTVSRELHRGAVALETVAAAGEPSGGRKVIHLVRGPTASAVVLAQHGRSAEFQAPTAAQAIRMFAPVVRLSRAFPSRAGQPVELVAQVDGRRLRLAAAHESGRRSVELALSPSYGWTLLFSPGIEPGVRLRVTAALWLGMLILPAAYWAGFVARPLGAFGALGGAVIAGLGLLPAVSGFEAVHWSEWLGAGGGIALGWALARIAAYLLSRCGSPSTSAYSSS
jgi:hypothetical protein